jgi:exopolysaccharide biosynthesis polyprenyl glycosylphosphotransferase
LTAADIASPVRVTTKHATKHTASRDGSTAEPTTVVLPRAVPRTVVPRIAESAGPAWWTWEASYIRSLVMLDLLAGVVGAVTAPLVRLGSPPTNRLALIMMFAFPAAWVLASVCSRAYESRFLFVGNDEYQRVFRAALGLTAALSMVAFLVNTPIARRYVVIAIPIAVLVGASARYVMRQRLHRSWARGARLRRVILVGHENAVAQMSRQLRRERYHGLGVVGACLPGTSPGHSLPPREGTPPVYGTFDDVTSAVRYAHADTVLVLSCQELDGARLRRLAWQLENDDIDLIVASTLVDVAGDRTTIRPVDGLPLLHVEHPRLRGTHRAAKEVFDRVGALLGLVAISPVLLVIAALIRFGPGAGPAMFRQKRVGRDGREFQIFKFRTMYLDAEARLAELMDLNEHDGALFKMRNDPRITPVGRWLRRFSLDELPQLINVVLGHMSLVGPRPPLPVEVANYPADMLRRLVVKPGMTGLWQVSGRSDLSWEESIRLDLRYVENWSLTMDLVILARTVSAVLRLSGAY